MDHLCPFSSLLFLMDDASQCCFCEIHVQNCNQKVNILSISLNSSWNWNLIISRMVLLSYHVLPREVFIHITSQMLKEENGLATRIICLHILSITFFSLSFLAVWYRCVLFTVDWISTIYSSFFLQNSNCVQVFSLLNVLCHSQGMPSYPQLQSG